MTFLSPWWLGVGAGMAAAVVALHLLARRRPRALVFPTARFIPDRPATAASLATRPTDLPLLLLRVLLVVLLGLAFAQPVRSPGRRTVQIVLLDESPLGSPGDSAPAGRLRAADRVIRFNGSLSTALVAALRAAPEMTNTGDSLALAIISPFRADGFDAATLSIRQRWKGGIELVSLPIRPVAVVGGGTTLPPDDPLAATLALLDPAGVFPARLVRGRPAAGDTAWAREGGTLVLWPRNPAEMNWAAGPGDSTGGVAAGNNAVVSLFHRAHLPPSGPITAVWTDGSAAATTIGLEKGCVRNVAIPVPDGGDLPLRPSFLGLTRSLLSPCAGWISSEPASASQLDSLRGSASSRSAASVPRVAAAKTPANPWFLVAAALAFAAEPLLRRRKQPR